MTEQQSTYRQIFKATSIFGGVQVFNILMNIVKSKVIAILLGPSGIGLFGVLNSTLDVIKTITGLGLSSSAVKEISQSAGSGDMETVSRILKTLWRWLYITGGIGFIVTLVLAPYLSQWTFGNKDYTWAFIWLSIVLFLSALSSGQLAALQGLRKIGYMAKASMIGSFVGLILSIPLFYFFSYKGVVLSIILSAICTLLFSFVYVRKIETVKIEDTFIKSLKYGWGMIRLGVAMMFSGSLTIISGYLLKAYITQSGGIDDAGIFQSGFSITEGYFGLIFTAMAVDYYPRLVAVNHDNLKVRTEVNNQAEIGLLIALPIIVIALFFMPIGIRILYSKSFMEAISYINWAMLGNIFKVASWTMGYVFFAKGKSKTFISTAIVFNLIFLALNITGYNCWGIEGLGIAFLIYYFIHFVGVYTICHKLFGFRFQKSFKTLFVGALALSVLAFFMRMVENPWVKYLIAVILIVVSLYWSYYQLNKRLDIHQLISKKMNRK